MKALPPQRATPEQLAIVQNTRPGVFLIRGAAGSGKTTTALLRLRQLTGFWLSRRERLRIDEHVRVLVITYNRTLRGYIATLAEEQVAGQIHLDLTVSTFSKWAKEQLLNPQIVEASEYRAKITEFSRGKVSLDQEFLRDEVDYLMGRFLPDELDSYVAAERVGRGTSPRVTRRLRETILSEVVKPYNAWKQASSKRDWNDLACGVQEMDHPPQYDIVIADEAQDLSANQVRALMSVAAEQSSVTFVLDAAQRIYPRGFTWKEAGITLSQRDIYRLSKNHRNTVEICRFARPLLDGLEIGDDGTFPDFETCERRGPVPILLKGRYANQVTYALTYINERVDLSTESVAFLKPLGGGWFRTLKSSLSDASLPYVEITRISDWPEGTENIALSTMYSAKGLEFDHIIILGLNAEVTPHGDDDGDDAESNRRRLTAMAITRARKAVIVGYKPTEASTILQYLDPDTYDEVEV